MQNWDFFGTKFGLWSHLGPSPKFGTSIERLQTESTSSAIYCKMTISFGEILIFTSTVLGGFFLQIFKPGFLTFSQWDYHPALPG